MNYPTKKDLKNAAAADTWKFPKNIDLASLESEIDELDFVKFESAPVELSKLSYVVKNEVVKKTLYYELPKKN